MSTVDSSVFGDGTISPDLAAIAAVWDELPLWSAPFGLELLETVRLRPGLTCLDIGCGTGFPLLELAERLGKTSEIFGIDPTQAALQCALHKCRLMKIGNARVICGVAEELPFPADFFDLIVSNNGLNNVQDISKVLAECSRTSKQGAQIVFTVNLPGTMAEFYKIYERILLDRQLTEAAVHLQAHIRAKRRPVDEWTRLLHKVGYKVRSLREEVFRMKFLDADAFFSHHFIRAAFLESWETIPGIDDAEAVMILLRQRINGSAQDNEGFIAEIPFAVFDCNI